MVATNGSRPSRRCPVNRLKPRSAHLMADNGKPYVHTRAAASHLRNSPFYKLKRKLTNVGTQRSADKWD